MVTINVQEVWQSHISSSCSTGKWPSHTWPCHFFNREKNWPVSSHLGLSGLGSSGDTNGRLEAWIRLHIVSWHVDNVCDQLFVIYLVGWQDTSRVTLVARQKCRRCCTSYCKHGVRWQWRSGFGPGVSYIKLTRNTRCKRLCALLGLSIVYKEFTMHLH